MSRLAIAFVVALTATGTKAQDVKSAQPDAPAVAGANGTRPFLFDGRMKGDGDRQRVLPGDQPANAGTVVMPPRVSQPERER